MGNKRPIVDFPGRIRFVRRAVGAVYLKLYAVREEGGTPEVVDAVLRMINWSIRKDVVVVVVVIVAVSSSRWGSPSQ